MTYNEYMIKSIKSDLKKRIGNKRITTEQAKEVIKLAQEKYKDSSYLKESKEKSLKVYIRFGDIPENKRSKNHRGDEIIKKEEGVSVWDCALVNGVAFPLLPDDANETTMADYFYFLLGNKPVYLVTGTELENRGSVNEPLLGDDIEIIKDYTKDYEYLKKIHSK